MSGYLLDTNVVSEVFRSAPHPSVIAFLTEHADLWLSVIVIHELEYGLRRMAQGRRRDSLGDALGRVVAEYEDRILPLDGAGAKWAARFRAELQGFGRALDLGDALIAGTAKAHDLAIATRNVKDFDALDVNVVNPWKRR